MTSVGVISSAVIRIKRLKDAQRKDYPETAPFEAEGVVERLENVKRLLVSAYEQRKEEEAEVEIKEVVRLSYEIVNVIVDTLDQDWTKGGVKKLKDLEERLKGVQDKLSNKINPPSISPDITSTGSPRSKKAGPETKPKGHFLGIPRKGGNALLRVGKFIGDKLPINSHKSIAGSGSGSGSDLDSDPLFRSKSLVKTASTAGLENQVEYLEIATRLDTEIEITASPESPTFSPRSKAAGPETKPKGSFLVIHGKISGNALVKVGNFISNKLATNIHKITTASGFGSRSGSDSDSNPFVGIKPPVTTESIADLGSGSNSDPLAGSKPSLPTQSTTDLESQVENLEIAIGSNTRVENIEHNSPSTMEYKASDLEPKPETSSSEIQILEEENKSSLMDEIKKELTSKKPKTREVYIVGKNGMGKSTLARNLYDDPDIRKPHDPFDVFGWVTLGHNFQIKGVLQLLLQQLQGPLHEQQPDMREMNETELIAEIFSVVHNKSYLLVLDDVGSIKDWESISLALPLANSTRVIITTSSDDFSSCPHCYTIPGLTRAETLTLLNKSLVNKEATRFGPKIGDAIYNISGGSPLYTTILGKALEWEAYDPRLLDELVSYKPKAGTPEVIDASYRRLPHELKPCFLYLGLFPPGQPIDVEKLYLLLLAENLIPSPEKSFRKYLDTLSDLKLVEVEEDDVLSKIGLHKSCRLHDRVQDFCKSKGLHEEFLEVVDFKNSKQVIASNTRRLAVYTRNYRGGASVSFKDGVKNIQSLLVFDALGPTEGKTGWPPGIGDLAEFTRLRALNFDEVDFKARKPSKGLEKLLLLRFLSFRGCFLEELPSSLGCLKQLEALDLLVRDECRVIIPADSDIFGNMKRMVHLYLPRLYESNGKKKLTLQGMVMLETLVNFDTNVFDVSDLSQMKKLKILSTILYGENPEEMEAVINMLNEREEKLKHLSMEIRRFDCYNRASIPALKKLIKCRFVHSISIEGEIGKLPEEEEDGVGCGERSLAEMVLIGSELEDDPMPYFGKFQNLRSLVLVDDAFMGTDILISASLFPKLTTLKLRNMQYLERLTIEEGALPELSSLQIESCGDALELTLPREVYHRLKNEIGGDAYSVVPKPSKFNTTPLIRCDDDVLVQTLVD